LRARFQCDSTVCDKSPKCDSVGAHPV